MQSIADSIKARRVNIREHGAPFIHFAFVNSLDGMEWKLSTTALNLSLNFNVYESAKKQSSLRLDHAHLESVLHQ